MTIEIRGVLGTIFSLVVYLAIGALIHHLLVAPYFDPYRMMSWGVLLGWPFIFMYVALLFTMFLGGAILAIMGVVDKDGGMAAIGAVIFGMAWFGWRLFF